MRVSDLVRLLCLRHRLRLAAVLKAAGTFRRCPNQEGQEDITTDIVNHSLNFPLFR